MNMSKKRGISFLGIIKAFPIAIMLFVGVIVVLPLFILCIYGAFLLLSTITDVLLINTGLIRSEQIINILPVVNGLISIMLTIAIIYVIVRLRYLFGSQQLLEIKNYHKSEFRKKFEYSDPQRIMFEYSLKSPYKSLEQVVSGRPNGDVIQFIKSKYPEWEYKSRWKFGSAPSNFANTLKLIEKIDIKELNQKIPLFQESIRLKIKNIRNNETYSVLLKPTRGLFFYRKPFYSISKKDYPELFDGNQYQILIKYKGVKGYSFKAMIK